MLVNPKSLELIKFQTQAAMWLAAREQKEPPCSRPAADQTVASPSQIKGSWTLRKERRTIQTERDFYHVIIFWGKSGRGGEMTGDGPQLWANTSAADSNVAWPRLCKEFLMAEWWSYIASECIDIFLLDVFNLLVKIFPTREHVAWMLQDQCAKYPIFREGSTCS